MVWGPTQSQLRPKTCNLDTFPRRELSTVVPVDQFTEGVDEIYITGVTSQTSLTFKVTDALSGRKGTGGS